MRLSYFSVTNYRSVIKAHQLTLENRTILIGKNNEGKSNLLRALKLTLDILLKNSLEKTQRPLSEKEYEWTRDFPIQLQERKKNTEKESIFRLNLELNESENEDFFKEIGMRLNRILEIEVRISRDAIPKISVIKKGKNTSSLTKKLSRIAKFVSERIDLNYIPAVRTESHVIEIIGDILSEELSILEEQEEFQVAMKTISDLQQNLLDDISENVISSLKEFIPTVNDIKLKIADSRRKVALRKLVDVYIDDGNPTRIEYKGDGIKSLAALAMLKNKHNLKSTSIIAIEEPESHLHPSAIHQLNDILISLTEHNQVLISTHNPLFVSRNKIDSNIIIDKGKAVPAKNIKAIREVLGVRVSDNLINTSNVLIVEGTSDKIFFEKVLPNLSEKIALALLNNQLSIVPIKGASNLSSRLYIYMNSICNYHVFLDNDQAGNEAYMKAELDGLLQLKNVTFSNCKGMGESELEDMLNLECYKNYIMTQYGVNLECAEFKNSKKWSNRMKTTFQNQGKIWNESLEKKLKTEIASNINDIENLFINEKRDSIDSLVRSIESMLGHNNH